MAFTVEDFQDLVRLLEERPEWRAELRRLLLPEEILGLPAVVRELAEQVRSLVEAQQRTEAELASLREFVRDLAEGQRQLQAALQALIQRVDVLDTRSARAEGELLEIRYERRAGAFFGPLLRRVRSVNPREREDLLDDALEAGVLTRDEAQELRLADLIIRGKRWSDGEEAYLVVEVSAGIGLSDVSRATSRAHVLRKLRAAIPVVAGNTIAAEAAEAAAHAGVWVVQDGRVIPPQGAAESP